MATKAVLQYLSNQNRPFSANDLVANMNKEFGKAAIQKALDQLVADQKIIEKTYGKQKVYCILQEDGEGGQEAMAIELQKLDEAVDEKFSTLQELIQKVREMEGHYKNLSGQPRTEEALKIREDLKNKLSTLKEKLDGLMENTIQVSTDEKAKIEKDHEKALKEYRKRKRICMDIVHTILESYPKTKDCLLEEIGIETDEAVEFKLQQT